MPTQVRFVVERETRGTYVFREVNPVNLIPRPQYGDPDTVIGVLYVRKSAFVRKPELINITIETETESE